MPKNHARKKALAELKDETGLRHSCAIALLDHPDADERETMVEYLETYVDVTTYREALDYLHQQQNDPRNQVMCDKCGWTNGMVCPECPGCGCYNGRCSGWRHGEYQAEMDAATGEYGEDDYGCGECGAGGRGDPYGECVCGDYGEDEDQVA